MTCGDAANAWVPSLLGSAWTGTVNGVDFIAVFSTAVSHVAATVVGEIPGIGTWTKDNAGFHWTASLEGYSWVFNVVADGCNTNGDVIAASGNAIDGLSVEQTVADMTRTL